METLEKKTVAEYVADNIKTAHVFKKFGIDFCCGGKITLQKACEKFGADYNAVISELEQIENSGKPVYNYNSWEPDFLADHIVHIHHRYVDDNIPILLSYAEKVNRVHGHHNTELQQIEKLVQEVCDELATHMKKEEIILFPYIKKLVATKRDNLPFNPPPFGTVDNPVRMMEGEHETAGTILKEIARLSNGYTPPEYACNTYRAFYEKIDEFEQDLHLHIHLENNILFPKAKLLEKSLTDK